MSHKRGRKPTGPAREWWTPVKLEPGKSRAGWVAGPALGVQTHYRDGASRICEGEYTGGDVACPYCACIALRFKTYLPMWSDQGARLLVIIPERYFDVADALSLHEPVKVTMLRQAGCPYFVGRSTWTAEKPRLAGRDVKAQDIWPHLLTMWKVSDEFRAWVAAHPTSDTAVSLPTPAEPLPHSTGMVPPIELVEAAHARRKAAGLTPEAGLTVQFPALAARIAAGKAGPAKNGKHAPPKKG